MSAGFSWKSLLRSEAPAKCSLVSALFTTYDLPDTLFLAEQVLPAFLKPSREAQGDRRERLYFLVELEERLKALDRRLVVVSSWSRDEEPDGDLTYGGTQYDWIWKSVRHLQVGKTTNGTQHAKLWLLHWQEGAREWLEIVVSSANLTRSAFTSQIQGAWRACLSLESKSASTRLRSWGILPEFLARLADSSGQPDLVNQFGLLLERADCPSGVMFLASVPGEYTAEELRRYPWGAAGLRQVTPNGSQPARARVLSPTIGSWTKEALQRWCASFSGAPELLRIAWIGKDDNGPLRERWAMPSSTLASLQSARANLLRVRLNEGANQPRTPFHDDHKAGDPRWSHAKVYALSRGRSKSLILTSANFSQAAWGGLSQDGRLSIKNFELGVFVTGASSFLDGLQEHLDFDDALTREPDSNQRNRQILWAMARWDGEAVHVQCRCLSPEELSVQVLGGGNEQRERAVAPFQWSPDNTPKLSTAKLPWPGTDGPPVTAELNCAGDFAEIPVSDDRPFELRKHEPLSDVDEDQAVGIRDQLLLEQFGGLTAEDGGDDEPFPDPPDPGPSGANGDDEESDLPPPPDSYSLRAIELAREYGGLVDEWARQMANASKGNGNRAETERLRLDGQALANALRRQAERDGRSDSRNGIGARVAAEELEGRVKSYDNI